MASVSWTFDKHKLDAVLAELRQFKKSYVKVGFLEGGEPHRSKDGSASAPMVVIAATHEYGVDITVTEKMRWKLHAIGIHLKKETTSIHIPERSFMRSWVAENKVGIENTLSVLLRAVEADKMSARKALAILGNYGVEGIRAKIKSNIPPPLKFREGTALWDTGGLINGVHYAVVIGGAK